MDISRIAKNVLPAVIVLVAGLFGMNFVYNSYMQDTPTSVISLEPSAGEDASPAESASESAMTEKMAEPTAETTMAPASEEAPVAETADESEKAGCDLSTAEEGKTDTDATTADMKDCAKEDAAADDTATESTTDTAEETPAPAEAPVESGTAEGPAAEAE